MSGQPTIRDADYLNPVYPHSFPDPFVLKFQGEYFAYCTGFDSRGDVFSVIRSADLVHWEPVGAAMKPLDNPSPYYWAPEVTYAEGQFYLYYSVGNETLMDLRVAVSDRPDGGFIDVGKRLTKEDFAIDAHVFIDEDGTKYLFYATDFLDYSHIGTGTVVDRMLDWFTLAGDPHPVTRAKYDWQVYDPHRKEKGGVRWHTVEGPSVIKRKGTYFEMFSGGNWQNTTYGVSFATTDKIAAESEWLQYSDGDKVLPILRTIPDRVVGPGHNCIVRGPNNRELYCVYHRWTDAGRVLAIDRMDAVGDRLYVLGATNAPQPAPFRPGIRGLGEEWIAEGGWRLENEMAISGPHGPNTLQMETPQSYLCEFTVLCKSDQPATISVESRHGELIFRAGKEKTAINLAAVEISPEVTHQVRLEVDGRWLKLVLDGWQTVFTSRVEALSSGLILAAENIGVKFSGFELTEGFEDLFDKGATFATSEWRTLGKANCKIDRGELYLGSADRECLIFREQTFAEVDLAVNIRAIDPLERASDFGLLLLEDTHERLRLEIGNVVTVTTVDSRHTFQLPADWNIGECRQYRILVRSGMAIIYLENNEIARFPLTAVPVRPAVFANRSRITIEMFRATSV